jgi:hypothetical protein
MAVDRGAATHDTSGDGTLPDGSTASGELMIAVIVHSTDTLSGLTGWTEFLQSSINGAVLMTLFWIIRGVSAPDLTYTGGGSQYSESMLVYTGTHQTTPIGTSTIKYSAAGTSHTYDSIDLIDSASALLCGNDVIGVGGAMTLDADLTSRINTNNSQAWADDLTPADPSGSQDVTFGSSSDCHTCAIEIRAPAAADIPPGLGPVVHEQEAGEMAGRLRYFIPPNPQGWRRRSSGLLEKAA